MRKSKNIKIVKITKCSGCPFVGTLYDDSAGPYECLCNECCNFYDDRLINDVPQDEKPEWCKVTEIAVKEKS